MVRSIARLLLAFDAYLVCAAAKKDPQEGHRTLVDGQPVYIHPSSALFNRQPDWLIYHQLVLTSKEYLRECLAIDPKVCSLLVPMHVLISLCSGCLNSRRNSTRLRTRPSSANASAARRSSLSTIGMPVLDTLACSFVVLGIIRQTSGACRNAVVEPRPAMDRRAVFAARVRRCGVVHARTCASCFKVLHLSPLAPFPALRLAIFRGKGAVRRSKSGGETTFFTEIPWRDRMVCVVIDGTELRLQTDFMLRISGCPKKEDRTRTAAFTCKVPVYTSICLIIRAYYTFRIAFVLQNRANPECCC